MARNADLPDVIATLTSTLPSERNAPDALTADWADFKRLIESCTQFPRERSIQLGNGGGNAGRSVEKVLEILVVAVEQVALVLIVAGRASQAVLQLEIDRAERMVQVRRAVFLNVVDHVDPFGHRHVETEIRLVDVVLTDLPDFGAFEAVELEQIDVVPDTQRRFRLSGPAAAGVQRLVGVVAFAHGVEPLNGRKYRHARVNPVPAV